MFYKVFKLTYLIFVKNNFAIKTVNNIFLLSLVFILGLSSCLKEKIDTPVRIINIGADHRINDIYFVNKMLGFAVGGSRFDEGYIFKTTNGGETWTRIQDNAISINTETGLQTLNGIHFYNESIGQIVGHGGKILRTEDGGDNWDMIINGSWASFSDIYMHSPQKTTIVSNAAYSGGDIFNSTSAWYNFDREVLNYAARSVVFLSPEIGFIAGYGIIKKTTDAGKNYQILDIRNDYFFDISFPTASTGYVCGWEGGVYKTEDQGETWKTVNPNNKVFGARQHYENIHFINENEGIVCGYNGHILYTNDGGNSWQKLETNTKENFHSIYFYDEHTVFAGGENGLFLEIIIP